MPLSQSSRPTMRDVAVAAGVSRAAVSIAFRGAPGISEATKARILRVADELGYVRDESARVLRASLSDSIGVCFRVDQPFQLEVVNGLYDAVDESANPLILSGVSRRRSEEDAVAGLLGHRAGVLALISPLMGEEALAGLSRRAPVVSIGRRIATEEVVWVASDDQGGMSAALSHLLALGHDDILYLSSSTAPAGRDRLAALERAAATTGAHGRVRVEEGGWNEEAGVVAAETLLASGRLPTAVIGFNDRCALGFIEVLLRRGVEVPGDVSVIGFDDTQIAARRPISMTSIHQDPIEMARLAVQRAIALLGARRDSVPRTTLVPTSLTVRGTTGPARRS